MTRILSEQQKEKNRQRAKLYYQNHKEELKSYGRKRRKKFKEIINKRQREARASDPNKIEKQRRARQLPRQRWHQAKRSAARRQKTFNIPYEDFIKLIEMPCHYCGNKLGKKSETGSGLDRLNNNMGYEVGNVVSCCAFCNWLKGSIFNETEMKLISGIVLIIKKDGISDDFIQQVDKVVRIIKNAIDD
jgi:hypothetical protein